eukprot:symbB.v1.2.001315.t1/scaffold57.1/size370615/24
MCGESEPRLDHPDSDGEGSLFGSQVEAYAQEANLSDEDFGEVLSPFGPETFKSAVDCTCRDRAWFFTAAVEEDPRRVVRLSSNTARQSF